VGGGEAAAGRERAEREGEGGGRGRGRGEQEREKGDGRWVRVRGLREGFTVKLPRGGVFVIRISDFFFVVFK